MTSTDTCLPSITVIVAVFNGIDTLQQSIDSVAQQSYPAKELIVIDGDSKDGTVELLKASQEKINYSVSEPDSGVYNEGINKLYSQSGALIYPSTLESFGLPLVEARQTCLPVLASELHYVRDVLDPDQSFDPNSKVFIARAVKRFIGIAEEGAPLLDAHGFLEKIINPDK